jgi:hypothetical protein
VQQDNPRRFGCVRCRVAAGYDYGALTANEIGRQFRQPIVLVFRPAVFDRKVLSLSITSLSQASSQRRH